MESKARRESKRRYDTSEKGQKRKRRHRTSEKGREAQQRSNERRLRVSNMYLGRVGFTQREREELLNGQVD